jgi:hypothetical protein
VIRTGANRYLYHALPELIDGIADDARLAGECRRKEMAARSVRLAARWGERCDGYQATRDAQMQEVARRFGIIGAGLRGEPTGEGDDDPCPWCGGAGCRDGWGLGARCRHRRVDVEHDTEFHHTKP